MRHFVSLSILEQHLLGAKKKQFTSNTKWTKIRPYGFVMVAFETVSCRSIPGWASFFWFYSSI